MLVVLEVDGWGGVNLSDIVNGEKVNVVGKIQTMFFDNDYINKLLEMEKCDAGFVWELNSGGGSYCGASVAEKEEIKKKISKWVNPL